MRPLTRRRRGGAAATPRTADDGPRGRRLRPPTSGAALTVSIAALVVATGGSAYAGVTLSQNSVGTTQLERGAVTSKKLAKGAVTKGKLAEGAVTNGKLAPGAVSASKINPSGLTVPNATDAVTATNATNAVNAVNAVNATNATKATTAGSATSATTANTADALSKVTYIESQPINSPAEPVAGTPSDTFGSVTCPTATVVIAGGFFTSKAGVEINESQPAPTTTGATPNVWEGFIDNFTAADGSFDVWAICTASASTTISQAPVGPIGPSPR